MNCAICLSELEKDYTSCKKCIYKYHPECLDQWKNHSKSNKCPICKTFIKSIKTTNILNKYLEDCEKHQQLVIQGYHNINLFENQFNIFQSYAIKCSKYIALTSIVVAPIIAITIINHVNK